ncbi:hypothetical protein ABKA04_006733 [Annulohypoxylon sp. FPYF3050]
MGKVKQANGKAAKAANPLTAVKNAGVKKSTDSPKAKSKALAKDVASKAVDNKELEKKKKSKKVVEPESESESESDSDASESDSASEDSESDDASGSSDDDSGASESEEEKPAAKAQTNGKANGKVTKPATNGKAKAAKEESSDDSDSSDDDEEDSDDSDDSEEKGAKVAKPAAAAAEKTKTKDESDEDSDDSEEDSDDSDDSSEESEEAEKKPEQPKKRKAEEEVSTPFKKSKTETESSGDEYTTLFVGNLGWAVDDDKLYETFQDCADLSSARVVTDKAMQRSRGFGYVDFSSHEGAKAAFEKMNGFELEGRELRLDPSKPRPAEDSTPNARAQDRARQHGDSVSAESDTLFVGNLPWDADEDVVSAFFGEVAEVKSVRLPTDPESGDRKGFGYVTFNSVEDAKGVFNTKNGAYIGEGRNSRAVRLDFAAQRPPREGGFGGRGGGRGGFGGRGGGGRGGGRGGPRGGFGGRGGGGRGGGRGGFGASARGGVQKFEGKKITF